MERKGRGEKGERARGGNLGQKKILPEEDRLRKEEKSGLWNGEHDLKDKTKKRINTGLRDRLGQKSESRQIGNNRRTGH